MVDQKREPEHCNDACGHRQECFKRKFADYGNKMGRFKRKGISSCAGVQQRRQTAFFLPLHPRSDHRGLFVVKISWRTNGRGVVEVSEGIKKIA